MKNKDGKFAILPRTIKSIQATIDEIYALTSSSPFYGGFKGTGGRYRNIIAALVRRGCLIREGHRKQPIYTWNPNAMAPTKVFYENIAEEVVMNERNANKRYATKHKEKKREPIVVEPGVEEFQFEEQKEGKMVDLFSVSEREILDELYRRGWELGNGELVRMESIK